MSFSSLGYLGRREAGLKHSFGWMNGLYSSLYTNVKSSTITESTPCDGLDWGAVFGFGFSPDGSVLAAACENKCMLIYDPNNGKLINRRFKTHTDCVNCVRFLDNRMFATCSDDSTVRLWDARFLTQEIRVLKGHTSWVKNIEYSSSDGKLITSGFDGNIFAWDINNYSENEKAEPLFFINGMMRTKMTPDENTIIVSTLGGYFLLIHDLDLDHLKEDLLGFKPHLYRLMQLMNTPLQHALQYNYMFTRKRNRVEFMCDFPDADNAESISTMQVHPQGWCIASRNTTLDEESEWTCIHDIQAMGCGAKMDLFSEPPSTSDSVTVDHASVPSGNPGRSSQGGYSHRVGLHPGNLLNFPPVFWDLQGVRYDNNSVSVLGVNRASDDEASSEEEEFVHRYSDDDDSSHDSTTRPRRSNNRRLATNQRSSTSIDTSSDELSVSSFPHSDSSPERLDGDLSAQSSETLVTSNNSGDASSSTPLNSVTDTAAASSSSSSSGEMRDSRTPRGQAANSELNQENQTMNDDRAPSGLVFYEAMTISRGGRVRRRMAIRHTGQDRQQSLPLRSTGHMRIRNVKPRLLYYSEEPNVGRGFIKEQSFSPDGRVLASPFGNCVRLLAFNESCTELCDNVPVKPKTMHPLAMTEIQKSGVLASTFSPVHCMFVAGARDGSIAFCSPRL